MGQLISIISDEMLAPLLNRGVGKNSRDDQNYSPKLIALEIRRRELKEFEKNAKTESSKNFFDKKKWNLQINESISFISKESKDLDVASWIIEGLVRTEGFLGLEYSLKFTLDLLELYQDSIYPLLEDDGDLSIEEKNIYRFRSLISLNGISNEGSLIFPLKCVPLSQCDSEDNFCMWEYQSVFSGDKKNREQDIAKFGKAINSTDRNFIKENYRSLELSLNYYEKISDLIDRKCKNYQPSTRIKETLKDIMSVYHHFAKEVLSEESDKESESVFLDEVIKKDAEISSFDTNKLSEIEYKTNIDSRKEAIARLSEIQKYFRETEPHSPISYQLDQAIRWSTLPLPELMKELLSDDESRENYNRIAGIVENNES